VIKTFSFVFAIKTRVQSNTITSNYLDFLQSPSYCSKYAEMIRLQNQSRTAKQNNKYFKIWTFSLKTNKACGTEVACMASPLQLPISHIFFYFFVATNLGGIKSTLANFSNSN